MLRAESDLHIIGAPRHGGLTVEALRDSRAQLRVALSRPVVVRNRVLCCGDRRGDDFRVGCGLGLSGGEGDNLDAFGAKPGGAFGDREDGIVAQDALLRGTKP